MQSLNNLPELTQLVRGRAWTRTQAIWFSSPMPGYWAGRSPEVSPTTPTPQETDQVANTHSSLESLGFPKPSLSLWFNGKTTFLSENFVFRRKRSYFAERKSAKC